MTEYWVSQGNKWWDTCKIFISNNPSSIRNHDLGQRHKDNVTKRLSTMREEKSEKEKEQKQAARVLEQIEAKAKRSYQKDLAIFQEARVRLKPVQHAGLFGPPVDEAFIFRAGSFDMFETCNCIVQSVFLPDWEYESSSGYYLDKKTSCYYDPNSGFYDTDALVGDPRRGHCFLSGSFSFRAHSEKKKVFGEPQTASGIRPDAEIKSGPPPGRVVSTLLNPMRSVKGTTSLIAVKRKRPDQTLKVVSKEEADALKARESARKRVGEREKPLLGLLQALN
ncbi:hypothetical protein OROGR_031540 [Orobanche gracilis]